jgi:hypothetical protein
LQVGGDHYDATVTVLSEASIITSRRKKVRRSPRRKADIDSALGEEMAVRKAELKEELASSMMTRFPPGRNLPRKPTLPSARK